VGNFSAGKQPEELIHRSGSKLTSLDLRFNGLQSLAGLEETDKLTVTSVIRAANFGGT
jgi:hypothetical protein